MDTETETIRVPNWIPLVSIGLPPAAPPRDAAPSDGRDPALSRSRPPRYGRLSQIVYSTRGCVRCGRDFSSSGGANRTCPKCQEFIKMLSRRECAAPSRSPRGLIEPAD